MSEFKEISPDKMKQVYIPGNPAINRETMSAVPPEVAEGIVKPNTALDIQVGGDHYKRFKIQPIEFCQMNKLDVCQSNIIKYVCRHNFKNGLEDLKKAKHYIDLLIQMEYGTNEEKTSGQ